MKTALSAWAAAGTRVWQEDLRKAANCDGPLDAESIASLDRGLAMWPIV